MNGFFLAGLAKVHNPSSRRRVKITVIHDSLVGFMSFLEDNQLVIFEFVINPATLHGNSVDSHVFLQDSLTSLAKPVRNSLISAITHHKYVGFLIIDDGMNLVTFF
ncbi:MAG: hypothetical protein CMK92_05755 [Pseudomonas sp.]|nr:hypothetical protein [Pseudomonas sp.]|tara:strand:+ start:475 stop:792 length:318 start_codon:yes stop_codon:yes gene_type:complete